MIQKGLMTTINNRHLYFRLADEKTSREIIQLLSPKLKKKEKRYFSKSELSELHYCRSCYNHLAGKIGVLLTQYLRDKKFITLSKENHNDHFFVIHKRKRFFKNLGLDIDILRQEKGHFTKVCLDFGDRKYHLDNLSGLALL